MSKQTASSAVPSKSAPFLTVLALFVAACGGAATTSQPSQSETFTVIQPSISHAVGGAQSSTPQGPITRAWIAKLNAFVANYPSTATAEQRAALARATASPTQSGAPTAAPSATPLAATCDPVQQWRCYIGPTNAPRRWLVVNDGVAQQWLPAFQVIVQSATNLRVDFLTVHNCQNSLNEAGLLSVGSEQFSEADSKACINMHQVALKESRNRQTELVILTDQGLVFNQFQVSSNLSNDYRKGLRDFVKALRRYTSAVVLGQVVNFGATSVDCLNEKLNNLKVCYSEYSGDSVATQAQRNSAQAGGGYFINPKAWMCGRGICTFFVFDEPVTVTGDSLASAFAKSLAPVLQENLLAAIRRS